MSPTDLPRPLSLSPPLRRRALLGAAALTAWPFFLSPRAAHAESAAIRMGYTDSLWPLSRGSGDGGAEGVLVDLMNLVAARAGLALRSRAYPWARAQAMVQHGELDGFCTVRTAERLVYAGFCNSAVAAFKVGVFHRADDPRPRAVRSLEDLRALRQGSYLGNGYAREHLEWQRLRVENDEGSVLRQIALGAMDVFVSVEFTGVPHLVKLGLQDKLRFTALPFMPRAEYRFGLRRDFSASEALVARMEAATVAVNKSGETEAVVRRYQQIINGLMSGPGGNGG